MSDVSAIEWTDATWNPVTGCTRVSSGCAHCYIERTPPFRMAGRRFETVDGAATTGVQLHRDRLGQPLHWRKPRRVFVCSLADLFHDDVPASFLERVFDVMARCRQHTFQILTKRPERAREFFDWAWERAAIWPDDKREEKLALPNVWLGVSVENARYTWRADVLREIPAAVRFLSCEPLLGSLFDAGGDPQAHPRRAEIMRALADGLSDREAAHLFGIEPSTVRWHRKEAKKTPLDLSGIDWVIVGGESGPGARPMHPDWVREIRDACLAHPWGTDAGLAAFFFKQWGEWAPILQVPSTVSVHARDRRRMPGATFVRVGKKLAGRELDGRTWDEFPQNHPAVVAA